MSRIGNMSIAIPAGVEVVATATEVTVKGAKGELSFPVKEGITVTVEDNAVSVARSGNTKALRAMHGTTRAVINNMIIGVKDGYVKELEIHGVGYKAVMKGQTVVFSLGYSHEIELEIPAGITIELPTQTDVKISGIDKQLVGQVAAKIRDYSPVEPYKGKGVRYKGEHVRRKEGKAVA